MEKRVLRIIISSQFLIVILITIIVSGCIGYFNSDPVEMNELEEEIIQNKLSEEKIIEDNDVDCSNIQINPYSQTRLNNTHVKISIENSGIQNSDNLLFRLFLSNSIKEIKTEGIMAHEKADKLLSIPKSYSYEIEIIPIIIHNNREQQCLKSNFLIKNSISKKGGGPAQPTTSKSSAVPHIDGTTILTFKGFIEIYGSNFADDPNFDNYTMQFVGPISSTNVTSDDAQIVKWNNSYIESNIPDSINSTYTIQVMTPNGSTSQIPLQVYNFTNYAYPVVTAIPIAQELDSNNSIFINSEFHLDLVFLSNGSSTLSSETIPTSKEIFIIQLAGSPEVAHNISSTGEDVKIDSQDNVWFTQGGKWKYNGTDLNAGRIVLYNQSTEGFTCYNVPTNNPAPFGLYLDDDKVWFTAAQAATGNFISYFKPATFFSNETSCLYGFDFVTNSSAEPLIDFCTGDSDDRCFKRFNLTRAGVQPAQLNKDSDGNIWFSEFYGSALGKLNVTSENIVEYPLPPGRGTHAAVNGTGPWHIIFDGDLVWTYEGFDVSLIKLDTSLETSNNCTVLNANNENPCVTEFFIKNINLDNEGGHSMRADDSGNIWFTVWVREATAGEGKIGRITSTEEIQLFPALSDLDPIIYSGATGLTIEPGTQDICFGTYKNRSIGCLVQY